MAGGNLRTQKRHCNEFQLLGSNTCGSAPAPLPYVASFPKGIQLSSARTIGGQSLIQQGTHKASIESDQLSVVYSDWQKLPRISPALPEVSEIELATLSQECALRWIPNPSLRFLSFGYLNTVCNTDVSPFTPNQSISKNDCSLPLHRQSQLSFTLK